MADLPPTAVSSASSATTSQSGGGSSAAVQSAPANVVNLPANLQVLNQVVTLGARLVGANADGSVVLRTAQGDVTVTVPLNLPVGTPLQLQFQPGAPPTAMVLLAGGNQTVQQQASAAVQNAINNLPLPEIDTELASAAAPDLQAGVVLRALVLDPSLLGALPSLPPNSPLGVLLTQPGALANLLEQMASSSSTDAQSVRAQLLAQFGAPGPVPTQIGQLALPARLLQTIQNTLQLLQDQPEGMQGLLNDQKSLQALQIASQNLPGAAAQAAAQQTAGAAAAEMQPGTEISLKLLQIIPPGQEAAAPTPTGANTLAGQLTAQTVNGQQVVQTQQGPLLLQVAGKLPPGTALLFEPISTDTATAARVLAAAASDAALTPLLDATKGNSAMPRLEQALLALSQADGQAFAALMNSLPKLNAQFPTTALFFMQALQSGDIRHWLGDSALQAIRQGSPGGALLVDELGKEFAAADTSARTTPPGDWRQFTIPYQGEYGIATMRMAVRNHFQPIDPDERRSRGLDEDAGRITRFLFDIDFSELGPMQVDGLLRPRADYQKQLDVLLRTREMFPNDLRRELRELFDQSLGAYGLQGGLSFQAGYQNWVKLANARGAGVYLRE